MVSTRLGFHDPCPNQPASRRKASMARDDLDPDPWADLASFIGDTGGGRHLGGSRLERSLFFDAFLVEAWSRCLGSSGPDTGSFGCFRNLERSFT